MNTGELRKGILHALDQASRTAATRRESVDAAAKAYDAFLLTIAVPMMKQAADVLRAEHYEFTAQTPAGSVRLSSDRSPDTFIEFELDARGRHAQVIGRVSCVRGRKGVAIDERPVAAGKRVEELTEEDVTAFLLAEIPTVVSRP